MVAYEKNTGHPHPLSDGIKTLSKRATGSVPLTDDNSELWFGTISVGTPPQDYTGMTLSSGQRLLSRCRIVDFDTGSRDLFLPSPSCDSSCEGHKTYDPSASSTSRDIGESFILEYGDGSTVSGELYTDEVIIASLIVCDTYASISFPTKSSHDPTIGEQADAWRSIRVFWKFCRKRQFPARRPDGHGFRVYIGL